MNRPNALRMKVQDGA
uniref:Uncharacterized protein n=1 Tax=Anguilla anguilla TaxID=7936 RepID=A0A0E9TWW3_ANGAN